MFASTLVTDNWQGPINNESDVDQPTDDQIADAIGRLDAKRRTVVTLLAEGECHMAVGGGEGRYVGYVTYDNMKFHQLQTSAAPQGPEVDLCVGGQVGNYAPSDIVSREVAVRAALHFAATGELDPSCEWKGA